MELKKGDRYTPGERPWYRSHEKNYIVLRQSETNVEMARFAYGLTMSAVGVNYQSETIYQITN